MIIGGNITATIEAKGTGLKNAVGERDVSWFPAAIFSGFLDLSNSNDPNHEKYLTKIEESTHVFICDYQTFTALSNRWLWDPFNFYTGIINIGLNEETPITNDNSRMIISGKIYDVLLIDDPMGLHEHLEIYLKYVGGCNGS